MIEIIPNWHPMLVHFTVGLLSLSVFLHVLARLPLSSSLRGEWRIVAEWLLWLGGVFALATAVTGWLAYNSVEHDDVSHAAMTTHRNWALPTAGGVRGAGAMVGVAAYHPARATSAADQRHLSRHAGRGWRPAGQHGLARCRTGVPARTGRDVAAEQQTRSGGDPGHGAGPSAGEETNRARSQRAPALIRIPREPWGLTIINAFDQLRRYKGNAIVG